MNSAAAPGGAPLRFGLIGVDSSHSVAFTELLGNGVHGQVTGATVHAAWKAPTSPDLPPSRDRNDDLARELADLGVPFCATPEEVARRCDVLLVLTADPRTHPNLVLRLAQQRKPIYVLTRFALTATAAESMLETGDENGTLLLAGSPKRFDPAFTSALPGQRIVHVDLHGPLPTQPCLPPLAWYGIHLIDLAVAALGPDWADARHDDDTIRLTWADGRTANLTGSSEWSDRTSIVLHREDGGRTETTVHARPELHIGLLNAIISACRTGTPTVPYSEVKTTVRILEAASTRD